MSSDPRELEHFFIYLCGPIDFVEDGGIGWRDDMTQRLKKIGFERENIFNPCRKPLLSDQDNYLSNEGELMSQYRKERDWDGLSGVVSKIAHIDLRLVDKSDLVIAAFPKDSEGNTIQTYGTIHEIVVAKQQQKPVLVFWEGGKENASAWIMWLVGHENVWSTPGDVVRYLKHICEGYVEPNPKEWLFIDPKVEGSR